MLDRPVGIAETVQVGAEQAEIAISVDAQYRHHGLGCELVHRAIAGNRGVSLAVLDFVRGEPAIPHIALSLGGTSTASAPVPDTRHAGAAELFEMVQREIPRS